MPRNFPNWIQSYLEYTRASESPTTFHFWTAVSTIAGALRRRVWIDERYFQWTPNFYIILVGPPGVAAKSTTIRSGMKLLERLKIPFGPQSMTWQALTQSLERSIATVKYYDDTGQQEVVMSAVTIAISELGTFLKPDDSVLMDVLVSLWDGQLETWSHETKSSGNSIIKNPWLNIIGCTTPSWIQNNFPEHMIGGGLTSRVIFIYGDRKRQLVAYPSEHIPPAEYKDFEERLFLDLAEIATLAGEYKLTDEARTWGRAWYDRHWTTRPVHMAGDRYGGYIARKQTHIHKLAIVLSAARHSKLIIDVDALKEADMLITSVEPDMQKVFSAIGLVDSARQIQEIVSYVRTYRFIAMRELWKLCMSSMDYKDFQSNVRAAVEAGQVSPTTRDGQVGLSLPSRMPPGKDEERDPDV